MKDQWKTKGCDLDIFIYGLFCNPCLFGENSSHVIPYPGCVAQTASVLLLFYTFNATGALIDTMCLNDNTLASSFLSSSFACLSTIVTAAYTSGTRTKLRNKYNIDGSDTNDFILHCLCLPCAVCREAQEIRYRKDTILDTIDPMLPPSYQKMEPTQMYSRDTI